jgi:hypothetical protein
LDGADEVKASLSGGEGGVYALKELKFPAVGSWKLAFSLTVGEQTSTFTETVEVSCSGTGESGAACCTSSDCNTGLYCTDGSCGKDKVGDNGVCSTSEECVSGVCKDGKCQAASCTDQTKNGDEVDVDCGGSCGACGFGQVCSDASDCKGGVCKDGKCGPDPGGLLGAVDGDPQSIKWTTLASLNSNVADLAFHPKYPEQLWIVLPKTDSLVVVERPGSKDQKEHVFVDGSQHFLEEVVSISFGDNGTFGTCGDTRNSYGGRAAPDNFMGAVLWPWAMADFEKVKNASYKAHLDMLHSSPNCMGIASDTQNQFFAFNGFNGTIDWYDFRKPHVPGGTDHTDGIKRRFTEMTVKRVPGVPSNLVFDRKSRWLYVADTGNGRVFRMNVENAKNTRQLPSFRDDGVLWEAKGVKVEVIIPEGTVERPSGLALKDGVLYVSDHATGMLYAFSETGKLLNKRNSKLGPDTLTGLTVGPDNRLYFLDSKKGRLLRVDY